MAHDPTFPNAVIISEPARQGSTFNVGFGQALFLHFTSDVKFACHHPQYFFPELPNGQHFNRNDVWGPAYAERRYNGETVQCSTTPEGSATQGTNLPSGASPLAGHTIHVGSGPNPTPPPTPADKYLAQFDSSDARFVQTWPSAKIYLSDLLASTVPIPNDARAFLDSVISVGDEVYGEEPHIAESSEAKGS